MKFRFPLYRTLLLLLLSASSVERVLGEGDPFTLTSPANVCGAELSAGDYTLDSATIDCAGTGTDGSGLVLSGTASLNCQGNRIAGGSTEGSVGVVLLDAATLINCIISGFDVGIVLDRSSGFQGLTDVQSNDNASSGITITGSGSIVLRGVTANGNGVHGIAVIGSSGDNVLANVSVNGNTYYGIYFSQTTGDNRVIAATSTQNSQGIFVKRDVTGAVEIIDSFVANNAFHGYVLQTKDGDITISGGTVQGNIRHGILATRFGAASALVITGVTVIENEKSGIIITGNQDATIEGNMIIDNGQDGIFIRNVQDPTLNCNKLTGNALNGIQTTSDITVSNSLIFNNVNSNIDSGSATVTDTQVCESEVDCGTLDLSTECFAFDIIVPPTEITNAAGLCDQELAGPAKFALPADTIIDCMTDHGPYLTGDAVLDCRGSTILGRTTSNRDGIRMRDISEVRNCVVQEFREGIVMESSFPGDKTIFNVVITGTGNIGLRMDSNGDHLVTDSVITMSGQQGIEVEKTGKNTFLRVIVEQSTNGGIHFNNNADGTTVMRYMAINDSSNSRGVYLRGGGHYTIQDVTIKGNDSTGFHKDTGNTATPPDVVFTNVAVYGNGGSGILISDPGDHQITNCFVSNNDNAGIAIQGAGDNTITWTEANGNGRDGITLSQPGDIIITDSTANGNGLIGIEITGAGDVTIERVYADGNTGHGITLGSGNAGHHVLADLFVRDNNERGMNMNGPGTYTINNIVVTGNMQEGIRQNPGDGNSIAATIIDANVSNNGSTGYTASRSGDQTVMDSTFQGNTGTGVSFTVVGDHTFTNVNITNNTSSGISFGGTGNNMVTGSIVSNNGRAGIIFSEAGNHAVTGVTVNNNGMVASSNGISFSEAGDITIEGVDVVGNSGNGISLGSSTNGAVVMNTVTAHNNGNRGIQISGAGTYTLNSVTVTENDDHGIRKNTPGGSTAILQITNAAINGNGNRGLDLPGDGANTITGGSVNDNMGVGIFINGVGDNTIDDVDIERNTGNGISFWDGSDGTMIVRNVNLLENGGTGISSIGAGTSYTIMDTTVATHGGSGIQIDPANSIDPSKHPDVTITNVDVTDSGNDGIFIECEANHAITNVNVITCGKQGLQFTQAGDITIDTVVVQNCVDQGILFGGSTGGTIDITDVTSSDNGDEGIRIQGSGTYTISNAIVERNGAEGIEQDTSGSATAPTVTITNTAVRDNASGIFMREATTTIQGSVITGSTTNYGFLWRTGMVTMNCCEISNNPGIGFSPQNNSPGSTAIIDNSLIHSNGDINILGPSTTLGTVYACDAGPRLNGNPTRGDLRQTGPVDDVICRTVDGNAGGCPVSCDDAAGSLSVFEDTIAGACAAYPLVGGEPDRRRRAE